MSKETIDEAAHRNTQATRLRRVLKDQRWHSGGGLNSSIGWRFGAALERIRKGKDGQPVWEVLSERLKKVKSGSRWRYRWTGRVLPKPQLMKAPRCCPHCGGGL